MGPSTAAMVECLPGPLLSRTGRKERYPIRMARSILRQNLLSIDFLHRIGIVHSDLQPGNLLFLATDLISLGEIHLSQKYIEPTSLVPIERQDGKVDNWAPKLASEVSRDQSAINGICGTRSQFRHQSLRYWLEVCPTPLKSMFEWILVYWI